MNPQDPIFLVMVAGLPIVISVLMFRNEPRERPFFATFALAVIESSITFLIVSLMLFAVGIGGLQMFDGFIEVLLSLPIALVAGITVRAKRARRSSFL
jgi:CHASE2 domain-containing sensor protein